MTSGAASAVSTAEMPDPATDRATTDRAAVAPQAIAVRRAAHPVTRRPGRATGVLLLRLPETSIGRVVRTARRPDRPLHRRSVTVRGAVVKAEAMVQCQCPSLRACC